MGWVTPVLDLPKSFDLHNFGLYRCHIKPSARAGALIAELMAHIALNRR